MAQREWVEKDFYKELGVSSGASHEEVKKAARKLLAENHPDRNPGNKAAEERYKAVSEAKEVLTDPAKRKVRMGGHDDWSKLRPIHRYTESDWAYIKEHDVPYDAFEFQMLYGIRSKLQEQLRDDGFQVVVYVPYGTQWYPYYMRRLAERPANVWFILSNFFRR